MGEKITDKFVKKLAATFPAKKAIIVGNRGYRIFFDGGPEAVGGFGLRITQAGAMAFILSYRYRGGDPKRMTIGRWPTWSALQARERAKELKQLIDKDIDPGKEKKERRAAPRMSVLFDRYMTEYAPVYKKPRSVADDRYALYGSYKEGPTQYNGLIGKHFAKMFLDEVTADDIRQFHLGLKATPTRANRSLAMLSKLFSLAEQWEYRKQNDNPAKGIKKFAEKSRERFLKGEELAQLGKALVESDEDPRAIAAIRLLLFTGMRVGELLGLRQSDINMKDGVARLEDAKAGSRDVQLPAPALAVLASLSVREGGKPIIGHTYDRLHGAWQRICAKAGIEDIRIHDLRHTMGTYAGAAGFNAFLVKQLLGHKTLAMTDRYVGKHVDPLREASGRVADQLAAAMKGNSAEVVDLAKRGG